MEIRLWMDGLLFFFLGGGGGKKIQTTSGGTHGFTSLFQPLVLYPVDRRMVRDLRQGMEVCNLRKKWRVLFFSVKHGDDVRSKTVEFLLSQWLNFKLFGITYLVGKIKFKLFFQGSIG